jgi:hypothetical protein
LLFTMILAVLTLLLPAQQALAIIPIHIPIPISFTPTVTGLSPNNSLIGTNVTITGTGFTGATAVYFGSTATSFLVNSDTSITATAPTGPGPGGVVNVTVAAPGGTSATSNADEYTYGLVFFPLPVVTGISPSSGSTAGGTSVTITGTSFTGASAVNFGNKAAAGFSVANDTQVTATSPAGAGTVDVTVTTPILSGHGTSATNASDQFTYTTPTITAPTVTGVSPGSGSTAGGTSVTITGANLTGATAVNFGSVAATGFTVNGSTSITATSPAGSAGAVDVTVVTPGGTSATNANDQFTYTAPTITAPTVTGVSPGSGSTAGGTSVTITGANLTGATAVNFGSVAATGVTVNSDTSITATSPAGSAGAVYVTVVTPGGTSATSSNDQFTYATTTTTTSPATGQTVMQFYIGSTDYNVNGQVQSMDTAPVISDGRTLLPIRYVATPLNAIVSWDQAQQMVTVTLGSKTIQLVIGQSSATVNGATTPIDSTNPGVTPVIIDGRTMLPLRFIAESLGCQVNWNQAQQLVTVTFTQP